MKKIIQLTFLTAFIFLGVTTASAQTAQESATVKIPTSRTREVTSLLIYAVNSENERLLGDVTITIDDIQLKIADPPPIDGLLVPSFSPGSHHVVAKRKGYETVDQDISVDSGKEHQKLTLEFNPISGTPDISESDADNYLKNYQSMTSSRSVTSATYPNYSGAVAFPGTTQLQWSDGTISAIPSDRINYTNTDQSYAVPVKISLVNNGGQINGTELTQIQIIDQSSNLIELSNIMVENSTLSTTQNLYRYGCLRPNKQYALILKSLGNQTVQPLTFTFATGQRGTYTDIRINVAAFYNTNVQAYNSGLINSSNIALSPSGVTPICPSIQTTGQTMAQFGTQILSGGQMDLDNYNIVLSPMNGNYYLVSKTNQPESRQITFIDRGDGKGGFAFIPTQPSVQGINLSQSNAKDWYVTTYTRNEDGEINFQVDPSPSNISPSQYERALNKQIIENFIKVEESDNKTDTDSDDKTNVSSTVGSDFKLGENCKTFSDQNICFLGDLTIEKYKRGDLHRRISLIVQRVNDNISKSKDKKGRPFLNILTDNTTFTNIFSESALAVTCPLEMDTADIGSTDHRCVHILRQALGEESFRELTESGGIRDMTLMAYRDENRTSDKIDDEVFKNTIDHEWAHVYDNQSDFKGKNMSISVNSDYIFDSFFADSASEAKDQASKAVSSGSMQTFNFEGASKQYPYCVYSALEFATFVSVDSKNVRVSYQFSGNVFSHQSEVFAYSYGIYKYEMLDKITNLMSKTNINTLCKEKIRAVVNEHKKFFND